MSGNNLLDGRTRNEATGRIRQDRADRKELQSAKKFGTLRRGCEATRRRPASQNTGRTATHDVAAA